MSRITYCSTSLCNFLRWFWIFFSFLPAFIPARYILSILGSIAMAIIYGLKVNLSVAMVAMVNHTAVGLLSPHAEEDHGSSMLNATKIVRVECEAEVRNSSTPNQVKWESNCADTNWWRVGKNQQSIQSSGGDHSSDVWSHCRKICVRVKPIYLLFASGRKWKRNLKHFGIFGSN